MNDRLSLTFTAPPAQAERLAHLQTIFAAACNQLAPVVQQTRCWNRVALHHMVYRALREQFPALGSQMACNAIYSVSRTCRAVYQGRNSPYSLQKLAGRPLPRVLFLPGSPVYFDRHTLSLKDGQVSMYTLDGRMKFDIALTPAQQEQFRTAKLREIVMSSQGALYRLDFSFAAPADDSGEASPDPALDADMPEYVLIVEDDPVSAPTLPLHAQRAVPANAEGGTPA